MYDTLDDETLGHLFAEAIRFDCKNLDPQSPLFIQDSLTLIRSLACHQVYKNYNVVSHLLSIFNLNHPKPLKSYTLVASLDVKLERYNQRLLHSPETITKSDSKIISNPLEFQEIEKMIVGYSTKMFNSKIICTDDLRIDDVVQLIIQDISN